MTGPLLTTYAIYNSPRDYPGEFVVRSWHAVNGRCVPGELLGRAATLEDARRLVPAWKFNMGRMPQDDPVIVETWI